MPISTRPPIQLTRHGQHLMLTFGFDAALNERVSMLPFARWDKAARGWLVGLYRDTITELRAMWHDGLLDIGPDDLLEPGEALEAAPFAVLRAGTRRRPFMVCPSRRDDSTIAQLAGLPAAQWNKKAAAYAVDDTAMAQLLELHSRGRLADPERLLPDGISVVFDTRSGVFVVHGDERAQPQFDRFFPKVDAVKVWQDRGIDVTFANELTASVYAGEIARVGPGLQPDGLSLTLYPFQRENVAVAVARGHLLVCDEPGLGKTMTGLAVGHELMNNRKAADLVIVVCPGGVKTHWAAEITRATGNTDVAVVDGNPDQRRDAYQAARRGAVRWLVVNYDVLHRDYSHLKDLASGAVMVADEVHRCKNPTTHRTKAMGKLGRAAAYRVGLTGTPVESNPGEFYWTLQWSSPGMLGDWESFGHRYMYPGPHGRFVGKQNGPELARRARPHFTRHLKVDVATHLAPLQVQQMVLDPDPKLATALRKLHSEAKSELAAATRGRVAKFGSAIGRDRLDEIEAAAEMTSMGMLRLVTTSPRLLLESESAAANTLVSRIGVPDIDGPKFDFVSDLAESLAAVGQRVVVFTFSRRAADMLSNRLTAEGIVNVTFTGSTSTADRDRAVRRFIDPADPVTVFIATDAGAEGLNLGRECSLLVNLDIPWTPTRMEQRANRIHRLDGTADAYRVINLTIRGTVESRIMNMVTRKADLMDAVFGEDSARRRTVGSGGIRMDELMAALEADDGDPAPPDAAAGAGSDGHEPDGTDDPTLQLFDRDAA